MNTHHFGSAALNEAMNGGIVYGPSHEARAAVFGHQLIMARKNVQHIFHVGSKIEKLTACWASLIKH